MEDNEIGRQAYSGDSQDSACIELGVPYCAGKNNTKGTTGLASDNLDACTCRI